MDFAGSNLTEINLAEIQFGETDFAETTINAKVIYYKNQPIRAGGRVFKGYFIGHMPIAAKVYPLNQKEIIKKRQKDFEFLYSPENKHKNLILYYGHASIEKDDIQ